MSSPIRTRNPRGEGAHLRDEILDAAIALLDESDSSAALTLRGVARRARISAPSIYAHFDNLPELVDAVLARSFDELRADVAAAVEAQAGGDPVGALTAAGLAYVRFAWQHRVRYHLMFAAGGYATNAVETFTVFQKLVGACGRPARRRGAGTRDDTWILWAGLHGVATLQPPARTELRRLGRLDRTAMLTTMIRRLVPGADDAAGVGRSDSAHEQ